MSPIIQAYLAGIGTSIFAVLALLGLIMVVRDRSAPSRHIELARAQDARALMRSGAIRRIA